MRIAHFFLYALSATILFPMPTMAWSPGPFPLHRMTIESDAALLGAVTKVRKVGQQGAFQIMLATVKVKRWLYGGKGTSAHVLFHGKTDGRFTSPHKLKPAQKVLLFLRKHQHVQNNIAPTFKGISAKVAKPLYVIQFAKGRNVGYLLTRKPSPAGQVLAGFLPPQAPKELAKALRIIKRHKPAPTVKGIRGLLWIHTSKVKRKAQLHLELYLRNMSKKTLWLWRDKSAMQLRISIYKKKRRVRRLKIKLPFKRSAGGVLSPIDSGTSFRLRFSTKKLRLAKGSYRVRAHLRGIIRKPFITTKPIWQGRLRTNDIRLIMQ